MAGETSGTPEPNTLLYRRIANDLRAAIASGEYQPGHALPSVTQLMERYGVSRSTVQNALSVLRAEGLTENRHGAGTVVRARPTVQRLSHSRLSRADRAAAKGAFLSDAATAGFTATVDVVVTFEAADTRTAAVLAVPEGTEVVVRRRVMRADGVPVQLATSRLPRTITRDTPIEQNDTGPGGTYARLEEAGHRLGRFVERVRSRGATAEEAARFGRDLGVPVAEVTRVAYTVDDLPVEINRMVLLGEWYELEYEIPAD